MRRSKRGAEHEAANSLPIYIRNAAGEYERAATAYIKSSRADWLRLRRTADGFFLQLSYLFRL